jgi:hypothetical protein
MTGVLITTDKNKEKNCVRDAYNILNDAVEHLYPDLPAQIQKIKEEKEKMKQKEAVVENTNININTNTTEKQQGDLQDAQDLQKAEKKQKTSEDTHKVTKTSNVSDLLEDELKNLRGNKTKLFYNFDTNCKGVVFIKIEKDYRDLIDIKRVVAYILENIKKNKEQISKNIARFIPVETGMKAKFDIFQKNSPVILDKYFQTDIIPESNDQKKTWKLEFKSRNNTSIHKQEYLDFLLSFVDKQKFQVDYKNPEMVVLLEITNDLLCLSVLEDYNENKCYNLLTLSKSEEELQLEKERLITKQRERENEKQEKQKEAELKTDSDNSEQSNENKRNAENKINEGRDKNEINESQQNINNNLEENQTQSDEDDNDNDIALI